MGYGMTTRVREPFAETVERVRAALKDQGFGVLTEIDVRWERAIPHWRTGRSASTGRSGCCCPATSSCALTAAIRWSKRSTRR